MSLIYERRLIISQENLVIKQPHIPVKILLDRKKNLIFLVLIRLAKHNENHIYIF